MAGKGVDARGTCVQAVYVGNFCFVFLEKGDLLIGIPFL